MRSHKQDNGTLKGAYVFLTVVKRSVWWLSVRIETCSTVWHDITVLCWTAYLSLFIDRAQLRALSSGQ